MFVNDLPDSTFCDMELLCTLSGNGYNCVPADSEDPPACFESE